jgi:hypothetical protein
MLCLYLHMSKAARDHGGVLVKLQIGEVLQREVDQERLQEGLHTCCSGRRLIITCILAG